MSQEDKKSTGFGDDIINRSNEALEAVVERAKQYGSAAEAHLKQKIGGMAKKAEGELLNKPHLAAEGEESIRHADSNIARFLESMKRSNDRSR